MSRARFLAVVPLFAIACGAFGATEDAKPAPDAGTSTTRPKADASVGTDGSVTPPTPDGGSESSSSGGCAQVALTETFDNADLSANWKHLIDGLGGGNKVSLQAGGTAGNPGGALEVDVPNDIGIIAQSYYAHALDSNHVCVTVSVDMKPSAPPSQYGINFMTLHFAPGVDFVVSFTFAGGGGANILFGEQDTGTSDFHELGASLPFPSSATDWHTIAITYSQGPTFVVTVDQKAVALAPLNTKPAGPLAVSVGDVYTFQNNGNSILLDNVVIK
jgi:hypothetical protein